MTIMMTTPSSRPMLAPNHKPIQPSRRQALQAAAAALLPLGSGANETATPFAGAECIAPSKPGGGFDLTCAVASQAIAKVRSHATPCTPATCRAA